MASATPTHVVTTMRSLLALIAVSAAASAAAARAVGDTRIMVVSLVLAGASVGRLAGSFPVSRRRLPRGVTVVLVNLLLFVVSTAMSVAAAEGAARWMYRDVTTTANFRGYFSHKWLATDVRHNHYGYRGAEFEEVKAPGVYRVAVMGDSFTYGNGVPEAQRFSNLLGATLADQGVEVLNLGFPGNNWPEHVRTLERRVLRLRPDFVLLQWGTNDVELDSDVRHRPMVVHPVADRDRHEWLLARSALYGLLDAQWARLRPWASAAESYDAYMMRLYGDPASAGAIQADTLMRRFLAACRERGVGVGLVLVPEAAVSLGPDYPYRVLHDRVAAICRDEGIRCPDLLPEYAKVPDRFALWVSPLDSHPSILANRMIADVALATFGPAWRGARAPSSN